MHNAKSVILRLIAPLYLAATISNAVAAPAAKEAEDRYIAARDAAIEKISAIYDAGNADDAARKAEEASAGLAPHMRAILNESARAGFGPARLHIDTFNKGDEGFGMLDGLRFEAVVGKNGEKAGQDGADGANGKVYVADGSIDPKVQIPACIANRANFNKKAEQAEDDLRFEKIDRKVYDRLGNLRKKGEDVYKRCFTQNAPKQPSFAEATRQASSLLSSALNKR
jgi:hypothetical protein